MTLQNLVSDNLVLQDPMPPKLSDNLQAAFALIQKLNSGFSLIRLLQDNSKTLMTAEGIAFHLQRPVEVVHAALSTLMELGLVRPTKAAEIIFFGLDPDPKQRRLAYHLLARNAPES